MYQRCIRAPGKRGFKQRPCRRYAGRELSDVPLSFHLQTIRAIIPETVYLKERVYIQFKLCVPHPFPFPFSLLFLKRLSAPGIALHEAPPGTDTPRAPPGLSYAEAAHKAMPAVVNIFSSASVARPHGLDTDDPLFRFFFGDQLPREQPASTLGSGVIVSSQGYILTNEHVINSADEIEVALADGRTASAKVIGADPETDLAVLKVQLNNLPSIALGHIEQARVGDVVLAIGNPYAVGQTVTMGIISALGRNHLGISKFENFIQTDASIHPGNSGGALVDIEGHLLGINTAIYSSLSNGGSLGIGFAIPVSTVRAVFESIIATGTVTRGWIGIQPQELTPEIAESFDLKRTSGAIVAGVLRNSPAQRAGVQPGDILIRVNNEEIHDTTQLMNVIAQLKPGARAMLHIVRKNKTLKLPVKIAKRPAPQAPINRDDAELNE